MHMYNTMQVYVFYVITAYVVTSSVAFRLSRSASDVPEFEDADYVTGDSRDAESVTDAEQTQTDQKQRLLDTQEYRQQMVLRHLAENQRHQPCLKARDAYDHLISTVGPIPGYDRPNCYEDGTFMPKQCKGNICYCMAPDGTRLGRYKQERHRAEKMHCLCALDQYGLSLLGMRDAFTCSHNGNYRRVQCYRSTCFCTDDKGNVLEHVDPMDISEKQKLKCKSTHSSES